MDDDPFRPEPREDIDIGAQVALDRVPDIGAVSATLTAEEVCRPRWTPWLSHAVRIPAARALSMAVGKFSAVSSWTSM